MRIYLQVHAFMNCFLITGLKQFWTLGVAVECTQGFLQTTANGAPLLILVSQFILLKE